MSDPTTAPSQNVPCEGQANALKDACEPSKPISQKQLEANRRNALNSTGPKTERGKRTVSQNAIKHGLFSQNAVIMRGDGAEDREEFAELLNSLHGDWQPVGIREKLLVDKIATDYWRLARVLRFEGGEIQKRVDHVRVAYTLQKSDEVNRNLILLQLAECGFYHGETMNQRASLKERLEVIQGLQECLRKHPTGIKYQRHVLQMIKAEIEEKQILSESSLQMLMSALGFSDNSLFNACIPLVSKGPKVNGSELSAPQTSLAQRRAAIEILESRLDLLDKLEAAVGMHQADELDALVRSLALPVEAATDRVIRSETHLNRLIYRSMDQLERLQRRRKGESVPPPLNVNLGARG